MNPGIQRPERRTRESRVKDRRHDGGTVQTYPTYTRKTACLRKRGPAATDAYTGGPVHIMYLKKQQKVQGPAWAGREKSILPPGCLIEGFTCKTNVKQAGVCMTLLGGCTERRTALVSADSGETSSDLV